MILYAQDSDKSSDSCYSDSGVIKLNKRYLIKDREI